MARIRSLHPSLLEAIQTLSLHGQFLVERLPLACDDFGRQLLDLKVLGLALFPGQSISPEQITSWLDELEKAGWIERYSVGGVAYLRMLDWRKWQRVVNPTPSRLPASPTESLKNYINIEATRILQGRDQKAEPDQELDDDSIIIESISASDSEPIDRKSIIRDFRRIQRKAERDEKHDAALKAVFAKAKFAGVHPAAEQATAVDPVLTEAEAEDAGKATAGDPVTGAPIAGDPATAEAGDDISAAIDASLVADKTTPPPAAAFGLPTANG